MKGKIIQIIPAPSNLFAVFKTEGEGESEDINVLCIALTDQGEILPMEIDDSGLVGEYNGVANFEKFKWK